MVQGAPLTHTWPWHTTRERKKIENKDLQQAVDLLTAELAAMKALEVRI
jgi:hypothetical protein